MTKAARTIRISEQTRIRVAPVLRAVLLSELLVPSPLIWLVSPWITDVDVIDNSGGEFDAVFGDDPVTVCRLSDALTRINAAGARIHVVTRPDAHNEPFVHRLKAAAPDGRLKVIQAPEVHEKTMCGQEWMLTGSMNFTIRGMTVNDEVVTYSLGGREPGQARIDLERRWERAA
ncbi:phospholipase D-like domain-containing protein DpdK [Amycolatopsis taiwanensis]|uniref:phospholipase D-like domain-containing protein DpdK n=1 Tax=Amycolatopsis taiwanensis TaxID=342230 RepID=UPI0004B68DB0|nr:phospholipase D-like domain-containing protein DpdK [Amycolatopsis taiwanensis]